MAKPLPTRRTLTNFDNACPTQLSKAPVFRNGRCLAGQLTAMALQIKRESLLPLDARAARRAAKAEALALLAFVLLLALLAYANAGPLPAADSSTTSLSYRAQ